LEGYFEKALENLNQYWGYPGFRDQQDEVVKSVFEGKDTLVLFPTGGGKSLCYQVPATVFDGLTLVISPLVALMQDQVNQLKDRGISATFINSTLPSYEVEQRLVNARNGMYKLMYCAPERLSTPLFQAELERLNLELIAIDEAHCISEWGHDFRPAYRTIKSSLSGVSDNVRWLALTATATPEVRNDILENLGFSDFEVISKPFKRENLIWWVIHEENKQPRIKRSIQKASLKGDGLMYGGTRKNCERWADEISRLGIISEAYHAGIESTERKAIQERWISGETPFVVATNAFGMGIDKPDCRFVIHEEMPFSIEAYYQEAGRAGRDGSESYPILFNKDSDLLKMKTRIQENYPTWDQLNKVYVALNDELGLALGSELLDLKSYSVDSIQKRSGQKASIIKSAIRLMDQFGVLTTISDVPARVQLQFTLSLEMIGQFKSKISNPDKSEFLDKLIRLFGHHAFSNMVEIETEVLLHKLQVSRNSLIKALNVLMQHDAVLVYSIFEGSNLIRPVSPRVHQLPISKSEVESYRNNLLKKLEYMHGYVKTNECREVYLLNYFGEVNAQPCGKCDNCLKINDQTEPSTADIRELFEQLIDFSKSIEEARSHLKWKKELFDKVLNYLITENVISSEGENPGYYRLVD
jgi:ATP-dependent DNA helicase RecQ